MAFASRIIKWHDLVALYNLKLAQSDTARLERVEKSLHRAAKPNPG